MPGSRKIQVRVVAMRVRRPVVATVAVVLALPLAAATGGATGAAAADCHPFTTTADVRPSVPTAKSVLGFDLGQREVTAAESDRYLRAIDAASNRLVAAPVLGTSHQGRALSLRRSSARRPGWPRLKAAAATLRDPATSPAQARATAASAPAILWVAGNVHGGEESGTDASLQVLYELADRTDCAARTNHATTRWSRSCRPRTRTAASSTPGATPTGST